MFELRLKNLRTNKGITQAELAKHLDVTQQAVGRWEKAITSPDYPTLLKLAAFFNVSVDYLLGRTDEPGGTGFQKGLLRDINGDSPLAQKAMTASCTSTPIKSGITMQNDILIIDGTEIHLQPQMVVKLKKAIELALYDELHAINVKTGKPS